MNNKLSRIGFSDSFAREAATYESLYPGRVITQSQNIYRVATEKADLLAEITGKLRYTAMENADLPAVGDFVMLDRLDDSTGHAIIHYVLKRKSLFERKAAGERTEAQVIAANIDKVFICMALNNDYNLRRLERYLAIAWASGALPVVVLTKADLCIDPAEKMAEVSALAAGADVLLSSGLSESGYLPVLDYIAAGETVAFIGSSGVGKSTLINRLLGEEVIATKEIRKDDKGRHTTSRRELFLTPSGAIVIDTPGMRELGLESADLAKTFFDLEQLMSKCRFNDCTHTNEPGCAVLKAIDAGELDPGRLESYRKLEKEARYDGLNAKQIEKEKINEMFSGFGGMKNARNYIKHKNKLKP